MATVASASVNGDLDLDGVSVGPAWIIDGLYERLDSVRVHAGAACIGGSERAVADLQREVVGQTRLDSQEQLSVAVS